jgi:pyruvate formate lyase activating enzyme
VKNLQNKTGRLVNIQKYSVHDGPGIRDLVFMKGCPLKCIWCSNPETQLFDFQLAFNNTKCIGAKYCGYCAETCNEDAIIVDKKGLIQIDRSRCINCFSCVEVCCSKALHVFGVDMTVNEVFDKTQDQAETWRSNGGITISGGEPLMQADFLAELLEKYKNVGIHTAIETTGYCSWENLEKVARWCNLIYYDVKLMNPVKHKKYTGVDNKLILENLKRLTETFPESEIIVRTPVIPGINDKNEEIMEIVDFLITLKRIDDYELLAYHAYGSNKYKFLGMTYKMDGIGSPAKAQIEEMNQQARTLLNLGTRTTNK